MLESKNLHREEEIGIRLMEGDVVGRYDVFRAGVALKPPAGHWTCHHRSMLIRTSVNPQKQFSCALTGSFGVLSLASRTP